MLCEGTVRHLLPLPSLPGVGASPPLIVFLISLPAQPRLLGQFAAALRLSSRLIESDRSRRHLVPRGFGGRSSGLARLPPPHARRVPTDPAVRIHGHHRRSSHRAGQTEGTGRRHFLRAGGFRVRGSPRGAPPAPPP